MKLMDYKIDLDGNNIYILFHSWSNNTVRFIIIVLLQYF